MGKFSVLADGGSNSPITHILISYSFLFISLAAVAQEVEQVFHLPEDRRFSPQYMPHFKVSSGKKLNKVQPGPTVPTTDHNSHDANRQLNNYNRTCKC